MNSWGKVFEEILKCSPNDLPDGNIEGGTDKVRKGKCHQQLIPLANTTNKITGLTLNNATDLKNLSLKKIKKRTTDKVEKEIISFILEKTSWNKSIASKVLKISYKTLLNKIDEFSIESF